MHVQVCMVRVDRYEEALEQDVVGYDSAVWTLHKGGLTGSGGGTIDHCSGMSTRDTSKPPPLTPPTTWLHSSLGCIFASRSSDIPVFNITTPANKRITWQDVLEKGRKSIHDNPFEMTVWYPDGNIRSSLLMHNLCVIFLHFLPAYFIDFLLLIFVQKRLWVMHYNWKIWHT